MAHAPDAPETQHLGRVSNEPTDTLDLVRWEAGSIAVSLHCAEFTSLCPVTGQPDFATLDIEYIPGKYIVETKSLKLWLWRFRQKKAFNEALTAQIADEFFEQVDPVRVDVTMHFHQRGGISVHANAVRTAYEGDDA